MLAARRRLAGREIRLDLIAVTIPVLVGALLCAIELNTRSLWLDEGSSFAFASQHGASLWRGISHDGGNMLLYYLLLHVVISLFGDAAWVMRLPSLLADAVTGGLVVAIGLRLLSDRRQAVAGGLLTVISLPLLFWGQDARGYSLMLALATASMLSFIVILEGPPSPGGSRLLGAAPPPGGPWLRGEQPSLAAPVAYVLTTLAALYVGYDAGLLILAQLAALSLVRGRAKLVLGCLATVAVFCVPLLVLALNRGSAQLFWVPSLSGSVLGQTAMTLLSGGMPPNFHHTATSILTTILSGALTVWTLALAVRAGWRIRLLAAWLLIPAVVALALSAAGEPIELARCAILLMPALSLLLVWLLARATLPRGAGIAAFAVLVALRLLQIVPSYGASPEDWKAASAYVLSPSAGRSACVAFYPQDGREVFQYYLQRSAVAAPGRAAIQGPTPVLPTLPFGIVKPFVEQYETLAGGQLAAVRKRCSVLFLLASHIGQSSGPAVSRAHAARYEELLQALAQRYPSHSSRQFGWAAPVYVTRYSR
jgi:Dolichyl-phosphate-mannose-protein mannosyltransferase